MRGDLRKDRRRDIRLSRKDWRRSKGRSRKPADQSVDLNLLNKYALALERGVESVAASATEASSPCGCASDEQRALGISVPPSRTPISPDGNYYGSSRGAAERGDPVSLDGESGSAGDVDPLTRSYTRLGTIPR